MNALIDGAMHRARTMISILVLLLVAGFLTYRDIPKEADPDVTIPFIYVSIVHDGISPEDAERMLIRPMETELRGLDGIKEMSATASEGHGSVLLEFEAGRDPAEALNDVRDRVSLAKAKLPQGTEEPVVREVTMADENPVLTLNLTGNAPERALITLARELKEKIEGLREVLEVEIGGDRTDIVEVLVDPLRLQSYNLDQNDIYNLLSRNNRLVAAGTLDTGLGRFAVKVPSVFESIQDVMTMPIKVEGNRVITFQDVAEIRRAYSDPLTVARINGHPSISLDIKKRPGENVIDTVRKVRELVAREQAIWPGNVQPVYTWDASEGVVQMLGDLQNNVLSAVLLVVIVIVATLGLRSASLVAISIPGSFLTGILVLAVCGYTINIVVLFALIMAVGMLVDSAIVVTEYADRAMSEGANRREAYGEAGRRMAWPIIASTATTLAAFAPLIFWPGIMGEFMKYLPITLIATLAASLVMALCFVPVLGGLIGKSRPVSERERGQLMQSEQGDILTLSGWSGRYVRVLAWAIERPVKILVGALLFAVLVIVGFANSNLGSEFFPSGEPDGANLIVRSHGDLATREKDALMRELEQALLPVRDIKTLYTLTGGEDRIGSFRLNFHDWSERRPAKAILAEVRERLSGYAGVEIDVREDQNGPPSGRDLKLEVSSRYPELLAQTARQLRQALEQDGAFVNVQDNGSRPGIEWQLKIDRGDAARFGADATLVGSTVQFVTSGLKLGEYRADDVDDELDIRVRFPSEYRTIDRLSELRLKTAQGQVPITNLASLQPRPKTDVIRKVDGRQVITLQADMAEGKLLSLELPRVMKGLEGMALDPRVSVQAKGQNEEQDESSAFLGKAFMVALFLIAIILVTQFNSFYQALLILTAVLFSTVGVLLGLMLARQPFGIVMSGIGVIALAGIVVNNNIVLIDTFNQLRREGVALQEAILRTGAQRLRPVLLTTVTTILGLQPMVLKINLDFLTPKIELGGPSTAFWSQLATTVAGGLAFATLLTLVLTPCLLALGERRRERKQHKLRQVA
ncbi:efflux RND transporter permease subunit [Aeromonas schubertii]|uniref:efflux RND transporter permease subunit n=1 Tax=Aeromonas schubertii TaxID=652 RepID=UPI001CC5F81B|nr:efflux RND transporter permease subunit [Aeromonas schubertii]MBZ6074575.1 efflux RND transporter permease subunit [Aeromonas schubertii]